MITANRSHVDRHSQDDRRRNHDGRATQSTPYYEYNEGQPEPEAVLEGIHCQVFEAHVPPCSPATFRVVSVGQPVSVIESSKDEVSPDQDRENRNIHCQTFPVQFSSDEPESMAH